MKIFKQKTIFYAATVFSIIIFGGAVYAANTGAVTTTSPIITPADPQATTTIEQRIAQRKAAARIQQSSARVEQLVAKCTLAQNAIGQLRTKDTKVRVTRNQAYTGLANRLNAVVINLGNQGVNASELFAKQKQFNESINKYLATSMEYKTAVDDLVNMDCKADTNGFESTLATVRSLRTQLAAEAGAIKAQLGPLIDALTNVKKQLNSETGRS